MCACALFGSATDLKAAQEDVIKELTTMARLGNHRNLVTLLGVCQLENPTRLGIVTDFMSRGSLLHVLKENLLRSTLPPVHPPCPFATNSQLYLHLS